MTLIAKAAVPLVEDSTPQKAAIHKLVFVSAGDELVLYHQRTVALIDTFKVDVLSVTPDLYWSLSSKSGSIFESKEAPLEIYKGVVLKISSPIAVQRVCGGYKVRVKVTIHPDLVLTPKSFILRQEKALAKQLGL